jgi:transposase
MQCMDRSSLEQMLGQGQSLAEIGRRFDLHESTVGYWVSKHGLQAVSHEKHAAKGGLARADLERLIEAGASIAEIAVEVGRSKATVRHWLKEYNLKTRRTEQRRHRIADCSGALSDVVIRECPHHGTTEFKLRTPSGYRCLKCRSEAVTERRRRVKQILVHEAGGACRICGYRRYIGALEFHHVDPTNKRFSLSHRRVARSLDKARAEARKCVLLCANCHVEVEAGIATLPVCNDAA